MSNKSDFKVVKFLLDRMEKINKIIKKGDVSRVEIVRLKSEGVAINKSLKELEHFRNTLKLPEGVSISDLTDYRLVYAEHYNNNKECLIFYFYKGDISIKDLYHIDVESLNKTLTCPEVDLLAIGAYQETTDIYFNNFTHEEIVQGLHKTTPVVLTDSSIGYRFQRLHQLYAFSNLNSFLEWSKYSAAKLSPIHHIIRDNGEELVK